MSHMITASGAEYYLGGLAFISHDACPVRIDDIAHHLAQINRFTGACKRPYSVAEHSLLTCEIARRLGYSRAVQRATLMHDGHEAYTTDLSSPAKQSVNYLSGLAGGTAAWTQFERFHAQNLQRHFGLLTISTGYRTAIRRFDLIALATERRDLTAWNPAIHMPWPALHDDDWTKRIQPVEWIDLGTEELEAHSWRYWRDAFRTRFQELSMEAVAS